MNQRQHYAWNAIALVFAILALAGSSPRSALSAAGVLTDPQYSIVAAVPKMIVCPKESADAMVTVYRRDRLPSYPFGGFQLMPIPGLDVTLKASKGLIVPDQGHTDAFGVAKFFYIAPKEPAQDELQASAKGIDPYLQTSVAVSTKDLVYVKACSYRVRILFNYKMDWKGGAEKESVVGLGKAQEKDGKLVGKGNLSGWREFILAKDAPFCNTPSAQGGPSNFTISGTIREPEIEINLDFALGMSAQVRTCSTRGVAISEEISNAQTWGPKDLQIPVPFHVSTLELYKKGFQVRHFPLKNAPGQGETRVVVELIRGGGE